ncbi:MAG: N-acetylmuramoyl-L-alanine amidase [FCB group bacterium]|nr:N-acetylmuramoyl-L-alanine amidase [FCB group bacterium]
MRKIKNLVVHHSLGPRGDGDFIMDLHTKSPGGPRWKYPGYHVVITNGYHTYNQWRNRKPEAPRVDRILSEATPANGCKYANANSLHVCLIGDFDKDEPTAWQKKKLADLLAHWCRAHGLSPKDIYGHGEMQKKIGREGYQKSCPGKNVYMDGVRFNVAQMVRRSSK